MSLIRNTCAFLVAAALLIPACGGGKPPADTAATAGKEDKKVALKDPATLIEGEAVTIPVVYTGLRPGMTVEEIQKVLPGFPEDDDVKDPAYQASFHIGMDDDTGRLRRLWFSLPKPMAVDTVEKAWGEPIEYEDLGKKVLAWFNPETGLRASLKDGFGGDSMDLEIDAYVPVDKFIGKEGPELAFASKQKILGATADQLKAAFPEAFRSKSQEEAEKDQKKIEALVGEKAKVLGPAKPSIDLVFGPTEYESYWTNVHTMFDDAGKVRRFWFGLAFEHNPAFKDTLFEMFKAKWGEPKEQKEFGKKVFVFSEDPRIEVKEDTISNKWDVAFEPKQD